MTSFDSRVLRDAMGQFATGVTVVAADNGRETGIFTANSFASVSMDPPLVLVCLKKDARSIPILRGAGRFAIHFLTHEQADIAWICATDTPEARDALFERPGNGEPPRLPGALARFDCELYEDLAGGDHRVFLGQILSVETLRTGIAPLTFYRGQMNMLVPAPESGE